jgi:hypothetical protein
MAICEVEPVLSTLERPELSELDFDNEDQHFARNAFRSIPSLQNFRIAGDEVDV